MHAFATVLFTDSYLEGALALGQALNTHDPEVKRVVLVTESVSPASRTALGALFQVRLVEPLEGPQTPQLELLGRPELAAAFTKLRVWQLVEFSRVVYLDADTLPIASLEHLFEVLPLGYDLAAAPDVGWPDCFNSGVLVLEPRQATFEALQRAAQTGRSFDGSDQGLLNEYFTNWFRLSFTYNVTSNASYQYLPAYERFKGDIKVLHFIGADKPWMKEKEDEQAVAWSSNAKPYEQLPVVDETKLVRPDPRRWDPTQFEPPLGSQPEAASFDEHRESVEPVDAPVGATARTPSPVHAFSMGPALSRFPWEGRAVATRKFL